MNKKIIIPGFVIAALSAGLVLTNSVSAHGFGGDGDFVVRIAERFILNQDEVQSFMDEMREEHHAEREAMMGERLDQAVADGKITEEQKNVILAKHEEIQSKLEELKDLDPEERRNQMQQLHGEMKTWADEQGIDLPMFMDGRPGFGGPKGGRHMGRWSGDGN